MMLSSNQNNSTDHHSEPIDQTRANSDSVDKQSTSLSPKKNNDGNAAVIDEGDKDENSLDSSESFVEASSQLDDEEASPVQVKKGRGRPRKTPGGGDASESKPKGRRGRPKKVHSDAESFDSDDSTKKGKKPRKRKLNPEQIEKIESLRTRKSINYKDGAELDYVSDELTGTDEEYSDNDVATKATKVVSATKSTKGRGRGRPRKDASSSSIKRKAGRPRKSDTGKTSIVKAEKEADNGVELDMHVDEEDCIYSPDSNLKEKRSRGRPRKKIDFYNQAATKEGEGSDPDQEKKSDASKKDEPLTK